MRNTNFFLIIIGIMLVLDIYVFQAVRNILPASSRLRMTIVVIYWALAVLVMGMLIAFPYINYEQWPKQARFYVLSFLVAAFFSKLIASVFFAVDDIRRGATWIMLKVTPGGSPATTAAAEGISRSAFLSWLGIAMGGGLFTTLMYGFSNKYNYQVKRENLNFPNLPASFKGLKVVHISDIHSGSFMNKQAVSRGIDKILAEQPDVIVFTGDLVNDKASEMNEYKDIFARLRAPMGVYSTLGNHDYGEYVSWESPAHKQDNLRQLIKVHADMGWRLLMNEHVVLERNNERIGVIGIENWSAKSNFPKYGKLSQAYQGVADLPFKILLSHDPSHWDAEVRTMYPDIDLTLSGHTHGMQFGVELPFFRWSPVQYVYRQWAGLYQEAKQKLYINRGFGFIGYPGRVGILPEISVITLT